MASILNSPSEPPAATAALTVQAKLQQALALHQKGCLPEAEAIYLDILSDQPKHADALHLLGVVAAQTNNHQGAVDLIGRAIQIYPDNAFFHCNLGNSLKALKQLAAAIASYDMAIAIRPGFAEAFYNRGVALQELNQLEVALASYDQAIAIRPNYVDAFYNRGNILQALNQLAAAVDSYDTALASKPNFAEALQNRGNALRALKQMDAAMASYDKAIAIRPEYANAHYNRGNTLRDLSQFEAAVASYDQAIKVNPAFAEAYVDRGIALQELGNLDEALACFDEAITLRPDFAEAHNNRGVVLQRLKQPDASLAAYDKAIALKPDYAEAHNNRGVVQQGVKQLDAAVASFDRAIALKADYAEAHNNRGIALQSLKRLEEAVVSHDNAIALKSDYATAYFDRAVALQLLTKIDAAIESYDRAIAIDPKNFGAYFNKAMALLLLGDFEQGWALYEKRWQCATFKKPGRDFTQPRWLGRESLAGRTILLHSEQGFGDTIQFCRYAKLVADLGARVLLLVPTALVGLLKTLDGVAEVLDKGAQMPDFEFDFHCPLLSLPLAFKTEIDNIPAAAAYLKSDAEKMADWANRLGQKKKPRIGLAWSGSGDHVLDAYRSMTLSQLLPYLPDGCDYVCLQKELRELDHDTLQASPHIKYFGDELQDFTDTAALCELMDLVVSVDTSVAHLAGALGKPTWIMLPTYPDWRWLLGRNDSVWYPSVRLYRQTALDNWDGVLDLVRRDMDRLAADAS